MATLNTIFACSPDGGIGIKGTLPWNIPDDIARFRQITIGNGKNAVIMGRKTWKSIPSNVRPLPNRLNIVISQKHLDDDYNGASVFVCLDSALMYLDNFSSFKIEDIFVIGGALLYNQVLCHPRLTRVYRTMVLVDDSSAEYDTFITSQIPKNFILESMSEFKRVTDTDTDTTTTTTTTTTTNTNVQYQFQTFILHEEYQYLNMVQEIIQMGISRNDRTGTGTLGLFGKTMTFNLDNNTMPLMTTKRVFWRGVVEELLWFISGSTDAKVLSEKDIKIWEQNGSREFLDNLGMTEREEGDLGPVYGFQWRHFGAKYIDCHQDYTYQGHDQLADVIHKIKNDPTNRRIVLSAWNPCDLKKMVLPPCHMFVQFYVNTDEGTLSSQMYQRSCDMGLGVPFNIASYALLTHLIAHVCGLKASKFHYCMGDVHVYKDHVEPLREQLERTPFIFPTVEIDTDIDNIDNFKMEHIHLVDYKCHKGIKMEMSS